MGFHVRASRQSPGRWEISVLDKSDSAEPYNTMLSPVVKGLVCTTLQGCGDCVWMKGARKNEERRSGTSPSLRLWPSKSHAVIEYRTNASIYYLNMLHYHYASLPLSITLAVSHSHIHTQRHSCRSVSPIQYLMMKYLRTAGQRYRSRIGERQKEKEPNEPALSLFLCSVLCVKR